MEPLMDSILSTDPQRLVNLHLLVGAVHVTAEPDSCVSGSVLFQCKTNKSTITEEETNIFKYSIHV